MSFVPPSASRLPENIEAIYPLTSMQKALLFHTAAAPLESAMYFQQLTWVIRSRLDGSLFREAWARRAGPVRLSSRTNGVDRGRLAQ